MFVEAQSWFTPDGETEPGHVHLGGDLPIYAPLGVSPVRFPLTYQLHDEEGELQKLDFIGAGGIKDPSASPWTPIIPYGDYLQIAETRTYTVPPKPTMAGWQLLRPEAFYRDSMGRARKCRLTVQLNFGTGLVPTEHLMAESWPSPSDTDGRGYSNCTLHKQDIPLKPVSGIWSPRFRFHSSGNEVRHGFVSIDPKFHDGSPGLVQFDQDALTGDWRTVPMDTRELTNGFHKLCLKCSDRGLHPNGTMEGVLIAGFVVEN